MSHSKFRFAGQAEILRAAQKDENYIRQLNEIISNVTLIGGKRLWLKLANSRILLSRFFYYAFTTLCYLQTLGEEYTGVIPVGRVSLNLLSFQKMLLYVMLLSGGQFIVMNAVAYLENTPWPMCAQTHLSPTIQVSIKKSLAVFKHFVPYFERLNKSIFYCNGSYYTLTNRFLGVKHVLIQSWLKDEASLYGFKILAAVSLINLIASFFHPYRNLPREETERKPKTVDVNTSLSSHSICNLCGNSRKNTTVTTCGHLFCWDCIMEWLHYRKDCPYCKAFLVTSKGSIQWHHQTQLTFHQGTSKDANESDKSYFFTRKISSSVQQKVILLYGLPVSSVS